MNGRNDYWRWRPWMRLVLIAFFAFFAISFLLDGRFIRGAILAAGTVFLALRD